MQVYCVITVLSSASEEIILPKNKTLAFFFKLKGFYGLQATCFIALIIGIVTVVPVNCLHIL